MGGDVIMAFINRLEIANYVPVKESREFRPLIRHKILELNGLHTLFGSTNATGKTSICNAWLALLYPDARITKLVTKTQTRMAPVDPKFPYSHFRLEIKTDEEGSNDYYVLAFYGDRESMVHYSYRGRLEDMPVHDLHEANTIKLLDRDVWKDRLRKFSYDTKNFVFGNKIQDWQKYVDRFFSMESLRQLAIWQDNDAGEGSKPIFDVLAREGQDYGEEFFYTVIADNLTQHITISAEQVGSERSLLGNTITETVGNALRQYCTQVVGANRERGQTRRLETELEDFGVLLRAAESYSNAKEAQAFAEKEVRNAKYSLYHLVRKSGLPGFFTLPEAGSTESEIAQSFAFNEKGSPCLTLKSLAAVLNDTQGNLARNFGEELLRNAKVAPPNRLHSAQATTAENRNAELLDIALLHDAMVLPDDKQKKLTDILTRYADSEIDHLPARYRTFELHRELASRERDIAQTKENEIALIEEVKNLRDRLKDYNIGQKAASAIRKADFSDADSRNLINSHQYVELYRKTEERKALAEKDKAELTDRKDRLIRLQGAAHWDEFRKKFNGYMDKPKELFQSWDNLQAQLAEQQCKLELDLLSAEEKCKRCKGELDERQHEHHSLGEDCTRADIMFQNAKKFMSQDRWAEPWPESEKAVNLQIKEAELDKNISSIKTKCGFLEEKLKPLLEWRRTHDVSPRQFLDAHDAEIAGKEEQLKGLKNEIRKDETALKSRHKDKENKTAELASREAGIISLKHERESLVHSITSLEQEQATTSDTLAKLHEELRTAERLALNEDLDVFLVRHPELNREQYRFTSLHSIIENLGKDSKQTIELLSAFSQLLSATVVDTADDAEAVLALLDKHNIYSPVILRGKLMEIIGHPLSVKDGKELFSLDMFVGHTSKSVLYLMDEDEKERRKNEIKNKICNVEKRLAELTSKLQDLKKQMEAIPAKISALETVCTEIQTSIDQLQTDIDELTSTIGAKRQKVEDRTNAISEMKLLPERETAKQAGKIMDDKIEDQLLGEKNALRNAEAAFKSFLEKYPREWREVHDAARPFFTWGGQEKRQSLILKLDGALKAVKSAESALEKANGEVATLVQHKKQLSASITELDNEMGVWKDSSSRQSVIDFTHDDGTMFLETFGNTITDIDANLAKIKKQLELKQWKVNVDENGDDMIVDAFAQAQQFYETADSDRKMQQEAVNKAEEMLSSCRITLDQFKVDASRLKEDINTATGLLRNLYQYLNPVVRKYNESCRQEDFSALTKAPADSKDIYSAVFEALNTGNNEALIEAYARIYQKYTEIDYQALDSRCKAQSDALTSAFGNYDRQYKQFITREDFRMINSLLPSIESYFLGEQIGLMRKLYDEQHVALQQRRNEYELAQKKSKEWSDIVNRLLEEILRSATERVNEFRRILSRYSKSDVHFELDIKPLDMENDIAISSLIARIQERMIAAIEEGHAKTLGQVEFMRSLKREIYETLFGHPRIYLWKNGVRHPYEKKNSSGEDFCYELIWLFILAEYADLWNSQSVKSMSQGFVLIDGIFSKMSNPALLEAAFSGLGKCIQVIGFFHNMREFGGDKFEYFQQVYFGKRIDTERNGKPDAYMVYEHQISPEVVNSIHYQQIRLNQSAMQSVEMNRNNQKEFTPSVEQLNLI